MFVLTGNAKVQIKLGGAVTTNECPWVSSFIDSSTTTYLPGGADGLTSGATVVDVVSPAALTQRIVKAFFLRNADTVNVTLTVRFLSDSAVSRDILVVTMSAGDTLLYSDTDGFKLIDSAGRVKIKID